MPVISSTSSTEPNESYYTLQRLTFMAYKFQLCPWAIYQQVNHDYVFDRAFRSRNDAESYVKILRQYNPESHYEIVFELHRKPEI